MNISPVPSEEPAHEDANPEITSLDEVEIAEIAEELPPEKREMLLGWIESSSTWLYPIPPPEILAEYSPEAQRLFLSDWEQNSEHTRRLESELIRIQKRGQVIAACVAALCLTVSLLLGLTGHDVLAGIIGGATVVSLVAAFAIGKLVSGAEE